MTKQKSKPGQANPARARFEAEIRRFAEGSEDEFAAEVARQFVKKHGDFGYSMTYISRAVRNIKHGVVPSALSYTRQGGFARVLEGYQESMRGNAPAREIARRVLDENPFLPYTPEWIATKVARWRRENGCAAEIQINPALKDSEKYEVVDGEYRWKAHFGQMTLPVELADQIFYEFSRHGLDMTQAAVRAKHGFKIWEWHSLKRTLWLYKDSNIYSPHTEEKTPPEQLKDMIAGQIAFKFKDRNKLVADEYNKEVIRRYKDVIRKDSIGSLALDAMLDGINDLTAEWSHRPAILRVNDSFSPNRRPIVAVLADLHIGARVENLRLTPDYSSARVRFLLDKAAARINAANAPEVHLAIIGDFIESFTGLNHKNSWRQVEYGMVGAAVIREAMSLLEEFLAKINNLKSVTGIAGNHDRMTADNKEDRRGEIAEVIFYMLQRLYGNHLEIKYDPLVMPAQVDGIQYVFVHGDKKVVRDGRQAVIDHGSTTLFNLVIGGHVHSRHVIEDNRTVRWIVCPSVFTGNMHSEENGWNAKPGFTTIENDGEGLPIVTDWPL